MLAAVFKGTNNLVLEDYSIRRLSEGEVLVQVANCGVCGTDKHIYEGKSPARIPVILGHEYCGTVVEKFPNQNNLKPGDKVAVDPNIFCGYCEFCRNGKVNLCRNHKALGVTEDGGFAEFSVVPATQIYKLPSETDLSLAAFAEPLSCCIHGIELAEVKPGETIAILGGGTIGLLMIQLVKLSGASKIILIEPIKNKRNLGLELGADYAIDPYQEDFFEVFSEITKNNLNTIIECVGSEKSVELSVRLTNKGTKIIIFGLAPKDHTVKLNLQYLFQNEINIINSLLNPFTFSPAVELLVNNKIEVKKLISKRSFLESIIEVFDQADNSQTIKNQIIISKEAV